MYCTILGHLRPAVPCATCGRAQVCPDCEPSRQCGHCKALGRKRRIAELQRVFEPTREEREMLRRLLTDLGKKGHDRNEPRYSQAVPLPLLAWLEEVWQRMQARGRVPVKRRKVARRRPNRLAPPPPRFLGFVTGISTHPDDLDRWWLELECLDRRWWDKVWRQDLQPNGGDAVLQLIAAGGGAKSFSSFFMGLGLQPRKRIYDLHARFVQRMLDGNDPAPVSLVQVWLRPTDWQRRILREARWYEFTLGTPSPYDPAADLDQLADGRAVHAELAMNYLDDPRPTLRALRQLQHDRFLDWLLKALHLPQYDPAPDDEEDGNGNGNGNGNGGNEPMDESSSEDPSDSSPKPMTFRRRLAHDRLGAWITGGRRLGHRLGRRLLDLVGLGPDGGFGPFWAPAGAPAGSWPAPPPERAGPLREVARPIAYTARPTAGALGAQMPNPMILAGGAHQPFVGVFDIGQGNLNALYDRQGRVTAYYDFGHPFTTQGATVPVNEYAPCVHDDPLVVLSHWDWDHYSNARRVRNTWDLRWIVPQQNIGSAATREVYGRVVNSPNGGEMYVWDGYGAGAAVAEHYRLPWGYLERGVTHDQLADNSEELNNGGLVMYVCVKSSGVAAGGLNAAAAPLTARGGAGPPVAQAKTPADNARAAVPALHFAARVRAVAEAAARAVAQDVRLAPVPPPADLAKAATAAVAALVGSQGNGTWLDALRAMAAAGNVGPAAGAVNLAAVPLHAALQPVGGASAAAAVPGNVGGVIGVGGVTAGQVAGAVAIADAVEAIAGAGPPFVAQTAAATAAAQAVAAAVGPGAPGPLPAVNAAVTAAVTGLLLDELTTAVAGAAAGSAAEVAAAAGQAPGLAAAAVARAAAAGVGAVAACGGTWVQAQAALDECFARDGANPVLLAATAMRGLGAGATVAARITANAGLYAGLGGQIEQVAAAAAIFDGAPAALASQARVAAVGPIGGGHQAQAASGAGVPHVHHNAVAAVKAGAASTQARALGQPVETTQVTAAAREAARRVAAANGAPMPEERAPLPPAPGSGAGVLGVPAGPTAAAIVGAGRGGGIQLANVQANAAPIHAHERYVLLTGDVALHVIPTQQGGPAGWPQVVGLTAVHHGAYTCFPDMNATSAIPWAPGSVAATAGAAASHSNGRPAAEVAVTAAAAFAGAEIGRLAAVPRLSVVVPFVQIDLAVHAAAGAGGWAAALANVAAAAGVPRDFNAAAQALRVLPGAAAAAAVPAGGAASALVAAVAAERVRAVLALPGVAWGGPIAVTAGHAAAGAAPAAAALPPLAGGVGGVAAALGAALTAAIAAVVAAAGVPVAGRPVAAAAAGGPFTPAEQRRAVLVASLLAALADGTVRAVPGGAMSAGVATAARPAASAVSASAAALGWPGGALPAAYEVWPGQGANGFAWIPTATVESTIENLGNASHTRNLAAAERAEAVPEPSGVIAYSYGVRNQAGNYRHYYGGAGLRHPHPVSVFEYASRGWTVRLNTSVNAYHSAQPDPRGAPGFVPGGDLALGWEAVVGYEGALRGDGGGGGRITRTCPLCGPRRFVCVP